MADILHGIVSLELFAMTVGFCTFVLLFHVLADWRSTAMGRHVMAFMGSCALILVWTMVNLLIELPQFTRMGVGVVLFGALTWLVWSRIRLLVKAQIISRGSVAEVMEGDQDSYGQST